MLERRNGKPSSLTRGFAFGNLKNNLTTRIKQEQKNEWNSNVQVKKPLRLASVEINLQKRAESTRNPSTAAIKKPTVSKTALRAKDNQKEL